MKILIAAETILSEQGGPTYSVRAAANSLISAGCNVSVITDGYDVEMPHGLEEVVLRKDLGSSLVNFVGKFDIIHDNAVWLPFHHYIAVAATKAKVSRVISPRGGLEKWIFKQRWLKKKIGWWLYQRNDLITADAVFATADIEANSVRSLGYRGLIYLHPNGAVVPLAPKDRASDSNSLKRALFLSRIHPKKGIDDLIDAWIALAPPDWELVIVGPDTDSMMPAIFDRVTRAGLSSRVQYLGMLEGLAKDDVFRSADLFILPTYSENFGNVILESILMGVPVLTTTEAPWQNLADSQMGWIVKPGTDTLTAGLRNLLPLSKDELFDIGKKARQYYTGRFSWDAVANDMIKSYREIVSAKKSNKY